MNDISLKQKIIGKLAEYMVAEKVSPPYIAPIKKSLSQSRVAFITTAGVHLKDQKPFDIGGDHTFRIIDGDIDFNKLTITHTHYDTSDAMKDINCVFPLERLRELESEGYIGSVSQRHFGLMGYIPDVKSLTHISAPQIADILLEDKVDIAILSPG